MRSEEVTPLSEWLARNEDKVSRNDFATKLDLLREQVDRYARGDRKPGLDLAFDIEEATREISAGTDVLEARRWWNWEPPCRRTERTANTSPQGSLRRV